MVELEERFLMRELYRTGVSISEIARRTGRDRKTIRQIVTAPLQPMAKAPRKPKPCKIDPYVSYLEQRIEQGVFNARKLYTEIVNRGYPGGETQVRAFVHEHRPPRTPLAPPRFETEPGEQGQVDWVRRVGAYGIPVEHGRGRG
jgi:transposase